MNIKGYFSELFKQSQPDEKFSIDFDDQLGTVFHVNQALFNKIQSAETELSPLSFQYLFLKGIAEQGAANTIPNGFILPSETILSLESDDQALLSLPESWNGKIRAIIRGITSEPNFNLELEVSINGHFSPSYEIQGPFIQFGTENRYLLTSAEYRIFKASKHYRQSSKLEYENLFLLHQLQQSKKEGADIELGHFEQLNIHKPETVTVELEEDHMGNFILTPHMQQTATHEKMQRVLGQLQSDSATTLKIDKEIMLFDEKRLKAIKEILSNRRIPKGKVREFLNNPTAFFDASLVDLDSGFSIRVKGITQFKHAYFGETDESGIDWFATSDSNDIIQPFSSLLNKIDSDEEFSQIKNIVDDAIATGSTLAGYEESTYQLPDAAEVKRSFDKIEQQLADGTLKPSKTTSEKIDEHDEEIFVVDIDLNDEELSEHSPLIKSLVNEVSRKGTLDWQNHKRKPFKHQVEGVRWVLGLHDKSRQQKEITGALLADDMGLGKTFISLSAIEHLYRELNRRGDTCKPILVIAPLTLLENWQEEIDKTFNKSPFKDVVLLQSSAELSRYKYSHAGVETKQNKEALSELTLKYSLKVGNHAGVDRLDVPNRLVISTYETLRDYQFSLCSIDWGMVIFDEAQHIKNPNTLKTRAAKGLKSDFKLLVTGTPIENSLVDFWCLMDTACPGYLDAYQHFRDTYIKPIANAKENSDVIKGQIGRELRIKVGALMLRRLKEDNLEGLPQKIIYAGTEFGGWHYDESLSSVMKGKQLTAYDSIIEDANVREPNAALEIIQKLKNVSLHPRLILGNGLKLDIVNSEIDNLISESQKLESVVHTLDNIHLRQEKCIIFIVSRKLQDFLAVLLGRYYKLGALSIINGDTKAVSNRSSTPTRRSIIKDFEEKEGFNVIIMSPIAAGVGLTIVGANNVIHYDRHWNPAKEAQATDRVYRIGQEKDVNIYIPILHHPILESFDLNLHKLLSNKMSLKDAVVTPELVKPNSSDMGMNFKQDHFYEGYVSPNDLSQLSWEEFEALSVELVFREYNGDECYLTNKGADLGVDGIVINSHKLFLIQAKHTRTASFTKERDIRDFIGGKASYAKVFTKENTVLILITNAKNLPEKIFNTIKDNEIIVYTGIELPALLKRHQVTINDITSRLNKKRFKQA